MATNTIHLRKITKDEWTAFHAACVRQSTTMTKVLMKAIREYIEKEGNHEDTPIMEKSG